MSSANVELARRGFDAAARGDYEVVRELLDPEVKWHGGDPTAPGSCHNREQALAFMRNVPVFAELRLDQHPQAARVHELEAAQVDHDDVGLGEVAQALLERLRRVGVELAAQTQHELPDTAGVPHREANRQRHPTPLSAIQRPPP